MRIVFMGTPDFAVPALHALLTAGHDIAAVYTQPPRGAGRGMTVRKSPVHEAADKAGLDVRTPEWLKDRDEQERFRALEVDAGVVVAYGIILPTPILCGTKAGLFNIHASLLPRWRGAAPINRAIMAGDAETGVSIMRVIEGLDAGPVCLIERIEIGRDMTAGKLHDVLAGRGAALIVEAMEQLEAGTLDCTAQPEQGVSYAPKIGNAETRIDWSRPAPEVHDHIRGLSPYPAAWFEIDVRGKLERIKALRSALVEVSDAPGLLLDGALTVACGEGAVRLMEVQRAGKKPVSAQAFLHGVDLRPGTVLH